MTDSPTTPARRERPSDGRAPRTPLPLLGACGCGSGCGCGCQSGGACNCGGGCS